MHRPDQDQLGLVVKADLVGVAANGALGSLEKSLGLVARMLDKLNNGCDVGNVRRGEGRWRGEVVVGSIHLDACIE